MRSLPLPMLRVALCALLLALASRLPCGRASAANDDACAALSDALSSPSITALALAAVPPGFCASVMWSPLGNEGARKLRGIVLINGGRDGALVVDATAGSLLWMNDTDGSGRIDEDATPAEFAVVLTQSGLNHGLALTAAQTTLLASSASAVYRWPFDPSNPAAPITAAAEVLVRGIPAGGHSTRTITLDPNDENMLYVSVGSDANVDPASATDRSLVARFDLSALPSDRSLLSGGFDYVTQRTVVVRGVRNEVGLRFDPNGLLWGVENGADNLQRADLGGDIHNENPGEEVHRFGAVASDAGLVGRHYGYPFCWSEYELAAAAGGLGRGTQWAWPSFMNDGTHSDQWCRDEGNNARPHALMQAHTAPLDLAFYPNTALYGSTAAPFAFPPHALGDYLFVAQHGSWNRQPAAGYRVVRFPLQESAGVLGVTGPAEPFLSYDSATGAHTGTGWSLRAVGLAVGSRGEMYLTDDSAGSPSVVVVRYVVGLNQSADSQLSVSSSSSSSSTGGATPTDPSSFSSSSTSSSSSSTASDSDLVVSSTGGDWLGSARPSSPSAAGLGWIVAVGIAATLALVVPAAAAW